jgi:hypothetical protein
MEMTPQERARLFQDEVRRLTEKYGMQYVSNFRVVQAEDGQGIIKPLLNVSLVPGWQPPPAEEDETET